MLRAAGGSPQPPYTWASGTIVASAPAETITQTWNNAGVTFTGYKINITDTASAAGSLLADMQLAGASKFSVGKGGQLTMPPGNYPYDALGGALYAGSFKIIESSGNSTTVWQYSNTSNPLVALASGNVCFTSGALLRWSSTADPNAAGDSAFGRTSAKVIEVNSGTAGTYTGTALLLGPQTVAQLPAAATALKGARATVTDATATTFLSIVAGTGANIVPVFCNGTNWLIG